MDRTTKIGDSRVIARLFFCAESFRMNFRGMRANQGRERSLRERIAGRLKAERNQLIDLK